MWSSNEDYYQEFIEPFISTLILYNTAIKPPVYDGQFSSMYDSYSNQEHATASLILLSLEHEIQIDQAEYKINPAD